MRYDLNRSRLSNVYGEIPLGVINGINATFNSRSNFIPESVVVYLNGLRQKIVDDYQTAGNSTIIFLNAPLLNEFVLIDYQRI